MRVIPVRTWQPRNQPANIDTLFCQVQHNQRCSSSWYWIEYAKRTLTCFTVLFWVKSKQLSVGFDTYKSKEPTTTHLSISSVFRQLTSSQIEAGCEATRKRIQICDIPSESDIFLTSRWKWVNWPIKKFSDLRWLYLDHASHKWSTRW